MSIIDINDACKLIRENWESIKNEFFKFHSGKYLVLTCVHRTVEEQMGLFKKGRSQNSDGTWTITDKSAVVTNVDGHKVMGAHNYFPSRAIDVAVVDNQTGKTLWEETYYHCLPEIANQVGLVSGGTWKSIKDWPHLEVPNYKTYTE